MDMFTLERGMFTLETVLRQRFRVVGVVYGERERGCQQPESR